MNRTELLSLLQKWDLQPSRKLGQSFLVDENVSKWIVNQLNPQPDDVVIEVGPGFGALTKHLVGKVKRLVLVEKDGRLARYLDETYGPAGVEVIHGDATEFDIRPFFLEGKVKFIGNLPYSVGNEILRRFLDAPTPIAQAVVMVQKEVAERFYARPRTKAYGVLSLMLQERWEVAHLKTVGPGPFQPQPEVDSTIVRFDPRKADALPLHCTESFRKLVKQGFSQRRKQLHNNLAASSEDWKAACEKLELAHSVRAEELTLGQWVRLSNELEPHPCADLPPSVTESLEVVSAEDEVIELRPRQEIHQEKLLHRAVHIFLLNRGGELYLQY